MQESFEREIQAASFGINDYYEEIRRHIDRLDQLVDNLLELEGTFDTKAAEQALMEYKKSGESLIIELSRLQEQLPLQ